MDYNGKALLVVGGRSNCGMLGVQLAKLVAVGEIVVVGSKRSEEEIKRYVHGDSQDVLGQIRDIVQDDLVYTFDAVSPLYGPLLALSTLSNTKKDTPARLLLNTHE